MPKNNLPLCPGYGDKPCPVGEHVRGVGRKYGAHCAKLSRAGFKAMISAQNEERKVRDETFAAIIRLANEEDSSGSLTIEFPQRLGVFPNYLRRMGLGTDSGKTYRLTGGEAQMRALVTLLRDEGIGVKVI